MSPIFYWLVLHPGRLSPSRATMHKALVKLQKLNHRATRRTRRDIRQPRRGPVALLDNTQQAVTAFQPVLAVLVGDSCFESRDKSSETTLDLLGVLVPKG